MGIYLALFFTVVLLVTTAYFLMGGLPLLILSHDTPLDGRFIRRFFEIYCSAATVATVGACLSYALWGQALLTLIAAAMALTVVGVRHFILPMMAQLSASIASPEPGGQAISVFRKVHALALFINLVQLCLLVWGVVTQLSF